MKLGALNFSAVPSGSTPENSLWSTIELASNLDDLGYSRFWLGEHHDPSVAHASPEVLAALIAATTERIRVGAAAILLQQRNVLRTAESFRLLSALYKGRIDIGVGRGIALAPYAPLLEEGVGKYDYGDRVRALLLLLQQRGPVAVSPTGDYTPDVWILGSQSESISLAASLRASFCYPCFLGESEELAIASCQAYHHLAQISVGEGTPRCAIAVAGICAETDAEANKPGRYDNITVRSMISGTPATVIGRLRHLADRCGAEEVIYLDLCRSHANKCRSYMLLAQECRLSQQ